MPGLFVTVGYLTLCMTLSTSATALPLSDVRGAEGAEFLEGIVPEREIVPKRPKSAPERIYLWGAAADVVSTAYALECGNGREGNPILTLAGDDTAAVVVSAVLLKWAIWRLLRRMDNPGRQRSAFATSGMIQFVLSGHNISVGC